MSLEMKVIKGPICFMYWNTECLESSQPFTFITQLGGNSFLSSLEGPWSPWLLTAWASPTHHSVLQLLRPYQVSGLLHTPWPQSLFWVSSSSSHALPTFCCRPPLLPLVLAGALPLRTSFHWTPPNATCHGWVSHSPVWASTGVSFQVLPWTGAICISVHLLHWILSSMSMDCADSLLHPQGIQEMLTHDYHDLSTPVVDRKAEAQGREVHCSGTSTQEVTENALTLNFQHCGIPI